MLERCGYIDDLLAEDFPVWSPRKPIATPDLVAFVRPDQRDMGTAAIVAPIAESEGEVQDLWLSTAAAIAAPAALIALPDQVTLWSVSADPRESQEVAEAPLEEFERLTNRLASLTPDAIHRFKTAGTQLSLFPADLQLLGRSRDKSRSYLTELVENAMMTVQQRRSGRADSLAPRLVIAAIATLMIRDKLGATVDEKGSLVATAQTTFPGYFDWIGQLDLLDRVLLSEIIDQLRSEVNFSSLEPAMVSDVYEEALVTPSQRRVQGTYYTPRALARQMLEMIPVETLPPENRSILDPACGSGTLLLAGVDRLEQLQPLQMTPLSRHGYLIDHLRGYDKDPFAVEISKLSLLMNALPIGNNWTVEARDVLDLKIPASVRPWIIVSNPPWGYERKEGQRNERANQFLSWMIDELQPGGFVACMLPVSWLSSHTSKRYREKLLSQCTLMELWRLPESTFHSSETAPTVVIAQKTASGHPAGRVTLGKRVSARPRSLESFLVEGIPDYAYITEPTRSGDGLLGGPITRLFADRPGFVSLDHAAYVHSGCAHVPGRASRTREDSTHRELASAAYLQAFGTVDEASLDYVRYPEDFHHVNKSDQFVIGQKVLVPAKRKAENSWRIKAALDLIGVVPRETLYMVIPRWDWAPWQTLNEESNLHEDTALYALLAILGSGLAACWIDELEPRRNVSAQAYRSLPVPVEIQALVELAEVGRRFVRAVRVNDSVMIRQVGRELEATMASAYKLPEEAVDAIRRSLGGIPGPEGFIRYEPIQEDRQWHHEPVVPSFGTVLDATKAGIRIWISGVTDPDGELIATPLRAPGWLCQPGVDFTVSDNLKELSKARFGLHIYDWIADEYPTLP